MKKAQVRKAQKAINKVSKKTAKIAKKGANGVSKKLAKAKNKTSSMLASSKSKLKAMKKTSVKTLRNAKNKIQSTEEDIVAYVQKNPVKSASVVALVALIGGYVSRLKK
jgi:ElaB/YqjD/DUF883 family membrane-anchored ribosome-binding protein